MPVVVVANFANLADHSVYDFDNDREIVEHNGAFYAHGSVLDNRLMYQGHEHTIMQLVHRAVLSMRNKGLYLLGERHCDKSEPKKQSSSSSAPKSRKDTRKDGTKSLYKLSFNEEKDSAAGSWFGWCGGRS